MYEIQKFSSFNCDTWSIGMTLHIWLTGKFPFELNTNDSFPNLFNRIKNKTLAIPYHLKTKIEENTNNNDNNIDLMLWDIITSLLDKNPSNRSNLNRVFDSINTR